MSQKKIKTIGTMSELSLYEGMKAPTSGQSDMFGTKLTSGPTGNGFLDSLPDAVLGEMVPFFREVELQPEEFLSYQDELAEWIYFPRTAIVSEFQMLEDGRTIEVALVGREGVVGAESLFSRNPSINGSQVYVGGRAYRLSVDHFRRDLTLDTRFQTPLLELIETRMKQLAQRLICSTFHSMEQRLCTWLLRVKDRTEKDRFQLTHEHIARSLGVHRPSISATLQHLRDRGLFDYSRAHMMIRNTDGLKEIACECYLADHSDHLHIAS